MAYTRPTTEQISFRSSLTGTHLLDTYMEACERGGFTLPQLMGNLFTSNGELDPTAIEFRVVQNGGTPVFQARFGHFTNPNNGWVSTNQNFFHQRGAYVAGTQYERLDMVYVGDKAYICKTHHVGHADAEPAHAADPRRGRHCADVAAHPRIPCRAAGICPPAPHAGRDDRMQ